MSSFSAAVFFRPPMRSWRFYLRRHPIDVQAGDADEVELSPSHTKLRDEDGVSFSWLLRA